MGKTIHENNGRCLKCEIILRKFPGIYIPLETWFKRLQLKHPEAHISCAGRGEQEQTELLQRGASKASWGKSAHNYNAALDIFFLKDGSACYDAELYNTKLLPELNVMLRWYGMPGASFFELPHVEVEDWKLLVKAGQLKLVE